MIKDQLKGLEMNGLDSIEFDSESKKRKKKKEKEKKRNLILSLSQAFGVIDINEISH